MSPPRARRRPTANQQAVVEILQGSSHFRSAQELYVELHAQRLARVGLTTVYRILQSLTAQNITEAQRAEDGETLYRLRTATGHRHYLVCRRCGHAVGFTPTDFELDASQLARKHRYTDVTHHIDLYGNCPDCTRE